jgi:hypothetical protein
MSVYLRNEFRSCYKRRKGLWVYVSKMKATIYLTYKPVNNNINVLLRRSKVDIRARYKSRWHTRTALFKSRKKVYGMFYQVDGNAATLQFYATDSKAFRYRFRLFYANLDSIMPRPVILKWHAAFNGDFKMEVILTQIWCENLLILRLNLF